MRTSTVLFNVSNVRVEREHPDLECIAIEFICKDTITDERLVVDLSLHNCPKNLRNRLWYAFSDERSWSQNQDGEEMRIPDAKEVQHG